MDEQAHAYPVRLEVDYPERLSRWGTLLRIILVIPLLAFMAVLAGGVGGFGGGDVERGAEVTGGALSSLVVAHLIAVLLRGRPVVWLFDVIVAIQRFLLRALSYILLLTDRYPPFEGGWSVRYEVDRPERLSRWQLVIWKTVLSIPHLIILAVLAVGVLVAVVIAWFAILVGGRYPEGLFGFVSGWLRWGARVGAYWYSLTDEFPSFSLAAEAGRASGSSYAISAALGWLIALAWAAAVTVVLVTLGQTKEVSVSYEGLLAEEPSEAAEVFDVEVQVLAAQDPGQLGAGWSPPKEGTRFVAFAVSLTNGSGARVRVERDDFRLKDSRGKRTEPLWATAAKLRKGATGLIIAVFEVREDADPVELEYRTSFGFRGKVKFQFE